MNKRYVIGIAITVLLLSINQLFIQYWLAQKKNDASIINIAGKQRMLSQRINVEFYKKAELTSTTNKLQELFEEWKSSHSLLKGDNGRLLITSKSALAQLSILDPYIAYIEQLLTSDVSDSDLNKISANQSDFLIKMDRIVKDLENESDKKLKKIILIEYLLFFISMLILILEVIYIYRPIEKKLQSQNKQVIEANENLNSALSDIEKKNNELEQITFITSHHLQEPLHSISGLVSMFKSNYSNILDNQGLKMMGFLNSSTERMQELIKDLLNYSIIGEEKNIQKIDCNDLIHELKSEMSSFIASNNAIIEHKHLPEIQGFKSEIKILFKNLISNGIKFQQKGHNPILNIDFKESEKFWEFIFTDNGIGINENDQKKIFTIFHRLHSKEKYEGTGIGLAQCSKIAELHQGKIWVESTLDNGSRFRFTIKKRLK